MGPFRRRKEADTRDETAETQDVTQSNPLDDGLNEQAQEVMKDNLEMMKDLVFRIREDPDFAKGIYKDCPRLQHLLDRYPDLRPIFEDPKMVRINFEQVYREAGGILPEDEEKKKKSWLVWFVNSPIFKALKVLLFVKKVVSFVVGGGIALLTGFLCGCCFEDALDELDGGEADGDGDADADADAEGMNPSREALNRAADHMEDPEVQEQIEALLEDPDGLQEAIENDSELKALRDSNPLCEELMSDPDTMRVLTDPDNLRALGEAPQLIEADFIDPNNFTPPDFETGDFAFDTGGDFEFANTDAEFDFDHDGEVDDGFDGEGEDGEGEVEEDDWWDEAELEEQDAPDGAKASGKGQQKGQKKGDETSEGRKRTGGIMASVGAAAAEMVAAQVVGSVFGAGTEMFMGGEDPTFGTDADIGGDPTAGLDGIGDAADDAVEITGLVEDTIVDGVQDINDDTNKLGEGTNKSTVAGGAVARSAVGQGVNEIVEENSKKSRFRLMGSMTSAIGSATKEYVASTVFGEDVGAALLDSSGIGLALVGGENSGSLSELMGERGGEDEAPIQPGTTSELHEENMGTDSQ